MSDLSYNGISLKMLKTNLLGRDVVYGPDGADRWYTQWTIDVDCIYNPGATAYTLDPDGEPVVAPFAPGGPLIGGALAPTTDLAIREALTEPRQKLVYSIPGADGPIVLLSSPAGSATVDAHDGPKPISCHVRQIVASKTWLVNFRIETYVSECDPPDQADPLLSNRYEVSHQINDQHLTTLAYAGVALFRSDALQFTATGNADAFRDRCLPPLPPGFQRKAIDVRVSSTGNSLMWHVVDVEKLYSTGDKSGILDFTASYTSEGSPSDGSGSPSLYDHASIDIRVVGNKNATKLSLLTFALRVALERLQLKARPTIGDDALLKKIQITEHMHDRIVDLRILAQLPPAKQGAAGLGGINGSRLGVDILQTLANDFTNPQPPNDSGTRGTFTGEAFAAALQLACTRIDPVKYRPGQSDGSPGYPVSEYNPPPAVSTSVGSLPAANYRYSTGQTTGGVYSDYKVEARWHNKTGMSMMPVAGDDDARPVFLKLHAPATKITYQWEAERNGRRPVIPTADHNDRRMILLDAKVGVADKFLAPDGMTPVYRVRGEYTYGYKAPGNTPLSVDIPVPPWVDWKIEDDKFSDDDVAHGIIDPNYVRNAGEDGPTSPGAGPGDPGPGDPAPIQTPDPDPTDPTTTSPGQTTVPGTPAPVDPPQNPTGEY